MKIAIVGLGHVGKATAFATVMRGLGREIVLISRDEQKAHAEALDLQHAASMGSNRLKVIGGGMDLVQGADVVLLCASVPMKNPKKPVRRDLTIGNAKLFSEQASRIIKLAPEALFIVVSNPVDPLTQVVLKATGLPWQRVIGTGTLVDSLRWRAAVAEHVGVNTQDVRAYILGEHGPTQFPVLSGAMVGGEMADNVSKQLELFKEAGASAFVIYKARGYTNYAIAAATVEILTNIIHDQRHTLPVSSLIQNYHDVGDICMSLPCIIGRKGIVKQLQPSLNQEEQAKFAESAAAVRSDTELAFESVS